MSKYRTEVCPILKPKHLILFYVGPLVLLGRYFGFRVQLFCISIWIAAMIVILHTRIDKDESEYEYDENITWADRYVLWPILLLFALFSQWYRFLIIVVAYFEVYPILQWILKPKYLLLFYAGHLVLLSRYFGFTFQLFSVSLWTALSIIISYLSLHIVFWIRERTIDIADRLFYWVVIPLTALFAIFIWGLVTWEVGLKTFRDHGVKGIPESLITITITLQNGTRVETSGILSKLFFEVFHGVDIREEKRKEKEREEEDKSWKEKWEDLNSL